jgi:hypothetical protein
MTRLRQDLPDEYVIVANPTVHGCALDAVVVGPQGLFIVHTDGIDTPSHLGWEEESDQEPPAIEARVRTATRALEAFLRDEFPRLKPELHHVLVTAEPLRGQQPPGDVDRASHDTVVEEISDTGVPPTGALPDQAQRMELAVALRDRRLTRSQRTSEPFVFRSGHGLSSGTEVWSVREAVQHMDAHPESGIFHLRNQTLADWLEAEGAERLARLARAAMRETLDQRAALELFLLGTGLVPRPRLTFRPKLIDMGYVLAGDTVTRRFRLGKGPGRGYVFGALEPGDHWLSVHPREFTTESGWTTIALQANAESLPIRHAPHREVIRVHSNASEEPIEIPVQLHVVGEPAPLNRRLLRPATGLATAGLLGAVFGGLLTAWGVPAADLLNELGWQGGSLRAAWVALIALTWAAFGAIRGATQPLAWPIGQTMARWWSRIGVWIVSLGLTGAAARWLWGAWPSGDGAGVPAMTTALMILGPAALAIVPGTIGEIEAGHDMRDTSLRAIRWTFLRPLALPGVALILALLLRLAAPRLGPLWQQAATDAEETTLGRWVIDQFMKLERIIQNLIDELYLRYYEG